MPEPGFFYLDYSHFALSRNQYEPSLVLLAPWFDVPQTMELNGPAIFEKDMF